MRVVRVDVDEHVPRLNVRTLYLMGDGSYAVSSDYADITERIAVRSVAALAESMSQKT